MLNDCWEWKGARHPFGHGQKRFRGKVQYTHRIAWEWVNGPIPEGMCVLHKCDNPPCCNPNHLFLGTNQDNVRDRCSKGRTAKGEFHYRAKISDDEIMIIRKLQGFTNRQIGSIFGISQPYVSRLRRSERRA